MKYMPET